MYEAKWFPDIRWIANVNLFIEVIKILVSSKKMSHRREKRIDKIIFLYYTNSVLKRIKKQWNDSKELKPYVKKALCQTIDAYLRKEYALVIL